MPAAPNLPPSRIDSSLRTQMEMLNYAIECHIAGDYNAAQLLYNDFLDRFPNHPEGLKLKGKLCVDKGQAAEGETLLRRSLRQEPADPAALLYLAEALADQQRTAEAIECYETLLKNDPHDEGVHYPLGLLYLDEHRPDLAIIHLKQTLEYEPTHYDALNTLGIAYQQSGAITEAEGSFRDAILVAPERVQAHINLGNLLAERHQYHEAAISLNRALELQPEHPDALFNLAYLWQMEGNKPLALAGYRHLLKLIPEQIDAMNNLGLVLESLDQAEEAQAWYEKALALQPQDTQTLFNLGNLHQYYQQPDKALAYYRQVLTYDPDNASAQYLVNALAGVQQSGAPEKYIQDLFDGFAHEFEECLLDELDYRTPEILHKLLTRRFPHRRYQCAVDLGCGTGLMGAQIAPSCDELIGVDLSPRMLAQAAPKNIYKMLIKDNLVDFLQHTERRFDLIVCADVLVYCGDLTTMIGAMAQRLTHGGVLLFSTETLDGSGFKLCPNGRFKHARSYVVGLLEANGLSVEKIETQPIRQEKGLPVIGDGYLAMCTTAGSS